MTEQDQTAIRTDLAAIVGERHVLTREDMNSRFDGFPPIRAVNGLCIVRPQGTAEVSKILAYCHAGEIPVVTHGGRTGLSGGARVEPSDVVLSMERLAVIEEVDPVAGLMVAQAGVPLQRVQEQARDAGFLYPVDLGARGSATIGGTIATNAGGNSVLRYGMTRDQILGLEAVLADGTVISSMNRMMKNNAGFDLKQLFIGSEGCLGVITRAVLRLRPLPGPRATALVGLESFASVLSFLQDLAAASDGALSSFEVLWPSFYETVLQDGRHKRPLEGRHQFYVLFEITSNKGAQIVESEVGKAWEAGLVSDATIAGSEAQGKALWAIRDDVEALSRVYKHLFFFDVSLPQAAMEEYVRELDRALTKAIPGSSLFVFGHVADGNLHVTVRAGEEAQDVVEELVYGRLSPLGGSVSAEHGIGLDKRAHLWRSRSETEIGLMRLMKRSLDPKGILNPGKVIPFR